MSYARFGDYRHDTTFYEILKVDIQMAVIGLRCVLTQDVEGMPYAMFDGVRHLS